MSVFSAPAYDRHDLVAFGADAATGLRAIIAVHDTTLGPGVGGCRMFPYASDEDALHDVLRLSRGMTYKSALAGLPFGGGKSVIIGDPRKDKSRDLLEAMADFVHSQGGTLRRRGGFRYQCCRHPRDGRADAIRERGGARTSSGEIPRPLPRWGFTWVFAWRSGTVWVPIHWRGSASRYRASGMWGITWPATCAMTAPRSTAPT